MGLGRGGEGSGIFAMVRRSGRAGGQGEGVSKGLLIIRFGRGMMPWL